MPDLAVIAAVADNGVIGRDNRLIWRLKSDLKRFRSLTLGTPLIMGRRTFESIGRPLPGRETVVLTRDLGFEAPGVVVAHGWEEVRAKAAALARQLGTNTVHVAGGAEIYTLALPEAARLHLTLVHAKPEGDTHFPPFERSRYRETRREDHPAGPDDEHPFTFVDLVAREGPGGAARRPPDASR
jgi:dihydrofolate reductase